MSIATEYAPVHVIIPTGIHRARIVHAEKTTSQKNNPMLVIEFEIYGYLRTVKSYIVFIDGKLGIAGYKLDELHKSFPQTADSNDTATWIGAVGAVELVHELYDGSMTVKVAHYSPVSIQYDLPNFDDTKPVIYKDAIYERRPPEAAAMIGKSFQDMLQDLAEAEGVMQYA